MGRGDPWRVRTNVPVALRALRIRRAWRQADLGRRAGLSRDTVSRTEAGELQGLTIGSLSRLVEAIDATLVVEVRWHGADLDRLVDQVHAQVQNAAADRLGASGWIARAEVSFNDFGDRGRIDLVAWHPSTRVLLVVEVKSRIGDVQETLGRLDVKARLGATIAEQLGWGRPSHTVPALVLAEDRTGRRVLVRHEALFRRYGVRGRTAVSWLRHPVGEPSGLLWFESADSDSARTKRVGRVRTDQAAG